MPLVSNYAARYPSLRVLKKHVVKNPRLSVLVRVKNEIEAIGLFLESVRRQDIFCRTELIILDSGSVDGTVEQLLKCPASVFAIAPEEFSYGSSCNLVCSLASAPIFSLMSGHITFDAPDVLARACEAVISGDPLVAAYVRQVPSRALGSSSYERAYLRRRFPRGSSKVRVKAGRHAFSNAASIFSAACWRHIPFPDVKASEDYLWAEAVITEGGHVFYLPYLEVEHSHNETPEAVYNRVKINLEARDIPRQQWMAACKYFVGVSGGCLVEGASVSEALRYGWAHARPYISL